jgi:hypothetical protein
MHGPTLPPGNIPGTYFSWRLNRPQGHIADGRIMSMKNSIDTMGNRTRDLPACHIRVRVEILQNGGTVLCLPAQIAVSHTFQVPANLFPFLGLQRYF